MSIPFASSMPRSISWPAIPAVLRALGVARLAAGALCLLCATACEVSGQGALIDANDIPDLDGDGVTVLGGDCDERSAGFYPGAHDIMGNGIDENCDGVQDQIVTIAGTGDPGSSGDELSATEATLNGPQGIALDEDGNLYVADTQSNKVRVVWASTGKISTVAGTGTAGFSGDKGSPTKATLNQPAGVALDANGSLYISDSKNNRIRLVTGGLIFTIAGNGNAGYTGDDGPATRAALRSPAGLVVDAGYNIYFADSGNNRIRKVDAAGTITTAVGTGKAGDGGDGGDALYASLNGPSGVMLDGAGHLYIADTGNQKIRRVDLETNVITTIAGNGEEGSSGDSGPATGANLLNPRSVALDGYGDLFIADTGNSRIRFVDPSGVITTSAGTGAEGYSGDNGAPGLATLFQPYCILMDFEGRLLVADTNNNVIRRMQSVTADTYAP